MFRVCLAGFACAACGLGLEVALRLSGGPGGNWFATSPQHRRFLEQHVQRNSAGFRDREFAATKPDQVTRILTVGDSFTFGDSIVDVNATWPRVLERQLNEAGCRVTVDNLGWSGTNTQDQRAILERTGWSLAPDRIVLGFVLNDPERSDANVTVVPQVLNPPLLPIGDLRFTRMSYAYAWLRMKRNQLLERFGRKPTYEQYLRSLYRPGPDWDAFVAAARGLVSDARAHSVPVTVALFPMFHDLELNPWQTELEQAASVFRDAGADVVDLRAAYRGRASDTLWVAPTDAHPNELGNRLAAEWLAAHLVPQLRRSAAAGH